MRLPGYRIENGPPGSGGMRPGSALGTLSAGFRQFHRTRSGTRLSEPADPRGPNAGPDDATLVERAKDGRADAFRALYQKYQERVFATAYRIVGHRDAAADLAQEVFVKAWEQLPAFRGESSFSTWLYRIAANTAINKAAETGRHARLNEDFARGRPAEAAPPRGLDDRVQAALAGLSVKLRAVVVLRYLEGLAYEEIAEALDLSVGTVKSRLFLAHETLKPLLEDVRKDDDR